MRAAQKTLDDFFTAQMAGLIQVWVLAACSIHFVYLLIEPWFFDGGYLPGYLLLRSVAFLGSLFLGWWTLLRAGESLGPGGKGVLWSLWMLLIVLGEGVVFNHPNFDYSTQFLIFSLSLFWLRWTWLLVSLGCAFGSWLAVRLWWYSPPLDTDHALLMVGCLILGLQAAALRRRILTSQWELLQREYDEQRQLKQALVEVEEIKGRLSQEMAGRRRELVVAVEKLVGLKQQQKDLHQRLLQTNRLQALGRLSAGLAHRLNNLLMVILGSLDTLPTSLASGPTAEPLAIIRKAVDRGAALNQKLLSLSAQQLVHPERIRVSDLVERARTELQQNLVLGSSWKESIRIEEELRVRLDIEAWIEIMANLVSNADRAQGGQGEVQLQIVLRGSEVAFSVSDYGPGVPQELQTRIFEPFFTTTPELGNTGLGLSLVLGLTDQMGGRVEQTSDNHGATFSVVFPVA